MSLFCLPAPSAPPTNLTNVSTEAFSVSIQWDSIDFLNQNGPNFVYNMSYSVEGDDQVLYLTTPNTNATISDLTPFTTYNITVSTVNDVGMGPSASLTIQTLQSSEYPGTMQFQIKLYVQCVCMCVCACVHACVRVCVLACLRACVCVVCMVYSVCSLYGVQCV